jgi:hypothetical protein
MLYANRAGRKLLGKVGVSIPEHTVQLSLQTKNQGPAYCQFLRIT